MFAFLSRTKPGRKTIRPLTTSWKPRLDVLEDRLAPAGLTLLSQQLLGGTGNEVGTAIAVVAAGEDFNVYASGHSEANGNEGLLARYNVPHSLANPIPVWNTAWPGAAGYDAFYGVAATSTAVYAVGQSFSQTSDLLGGKEHKGITASFPTTGGASTWARQTPAAPGAFSYGGFEGVNGVTVAVEGGQTFLYVTGSAQSGGSNGGRLFVSKLDSAGNVLWTQTDTAGSPNSFGQAVAALSGSVYVAGYSADTGTARAYLKKYDAAGTLIWTRVSTSGVFYGLKTDASTGSLYAVGQASGATRDFLVEKWDSSGNSAWSKTYDRNGAEGVLNGVTTLNGQVFAAGWTKGGTAGGTDGAILEIDPATGALRDTTLWGGPADDSIQGIAATLTGLHLVGTTKSFGSGGSDLAYVVYTAPVAIAVSVMPNGNIPSLAGAQHSRIASLVVAFDQPVQLDANALTLALHANNVTFNGAAQPNGLGVLPASLSLATTDNKTWVVTFVGSTEDGADGMKSLKDGVYDLKIDASRVHPFGVPGVNMAANSTTTFHSLFGDTNAPETPSGGVPGIDYKAAVINTGDNLLFRGAFNQPVGAGYLAFLDFNGDGIINSADNLQFRNRFNKALAWRV